MFAILPLGTANSFARTLGIGDDLDDAVEVIANGRRRTIDLGRIDDDYFANAAAIGLSPLIADTVPHGLKRWLGMAGYLIWAMLVAFKYRPFRMRLTLDDGETVERWATEVRIANGSHHGGVELVEHAAVDSGVDHRPGGHRQEPVGPGVELVRDPVQVERPRAHDRGMDGPQDDARNPAAAEDQRSTARSNAGPRSKIEIASRAIEVAAPRA